MLTALRNATSGIFAKAFLFILVISFAVWGASGAFIGGTGSSAVEFGSTQVGPLDYRLAYNIQLNSLSRQFGQRLTREQGRAFGVDDAVLQQMIASAVMDENARRMGLGISDDKLVTLIANDPAFQDSTGRFSRLALEGVLREVGMRQEDYVRNRKAVAVRRQFLDAVSAGAGVPKVFFDAYADYQGQRRVFDHVTVTPAAIGDKPVATDADIEKYYNERLTDYRAPEYRRLNIVRLTAEDIARPDLIDEAALAAEYEARKAGFSTPEKRRIQQLVFADRAKADEALARIRAGEFFDAIVTENGRTTADIDLGLLGKGEVPDVNVANAAFALELNNPSDVVDGVFGPVILRVTEIAPAAVKPIAEVSDELRKALALEKATQELYDVHDRLEDARAGGASLADAAKEVGLTPRLVEQIDRQGKAPDGVAVADLPESPDLLARAFEADPGDETDPLNLGTTGFVWYDVVDVTAERQKTLAEVREAAAAAWSDAEIARRTAELAETIRDRVGKGETLGKVAGELLPANADGTPAAPATSPELTRDGANDVLPAEALTAGFSVPQGDVVISPAPAAPGRLVMQVARVIDAAAAPVAADVKERLDQTVSDGILDALVADFQSRGDVRVNQAAIQSALSF